MRILKEDIEYVSLYEALVNTKNSNARMAFPINIRKEKEPDYKLYYQTISQIANQVNEAADIDSVVKSLANNLKSVVPFQKFALFYFNTSEQMPIILNKDIDNSIHKFIYTAFEDGVLDSLLAENNFALLPFNIVEKKSKLNRYNLIVKLNSEDKTRRFFVLLNTPCKEVVKDKLLLNFIKESLNLGKTRIEYLNSRKDIKRVYQDLQLYQSKLSKDYKLSAVGEMTYGFVDQIVSPMQVIMSCVDIISRETDQNDHVIDTIKFQIRKIDAITKKIVKFLSSNFQQRNITPCSLNKGIETYYEFIRSSFDVKNFEIIFDLDKDLPPILSNHDDMNQIFTNIFSLLINVSNTGGIYFQTKYQRNNVVMRVISTEYIQQSAESDIAKKNINFMIIDLLMKKHEGSFKFHSDKGSGSILELSFPLRRKVRK